MKVQGGRFYLDAVIHPIRIPSPTPAWVAPLKDRATENEESPSRGGVKGETAPQLSSAEEVAGQRVIDADTTVIDLGYRYVTGNEEGLKALIAKDRGTGSLFATIVKKKGPKCADAASPFLAWLREQGHARLVLQSDG